MDAGEIATLKTEKHGPPTPFQLRSIFALLQLHASASGLGGKVRVLSVRTSQITAAVCSNPRARVEVNHQKVIRDGEAATVLPDLAPPLRGDRVAAPHERTRKCYSS